MSPLPLPCNCAAILVSNRYRVCTTYHGSAEDRVFLQRFRQQPVEVSCHETSSKGQNAALLSESQSSFAACFAQKLFAFHRNQTSGALEPAGKFLQELEMFACSRPFREDGHSSPAAFARLSAQQLVGSRLLPVQNDSIAQIAQQCSITAQRSRGTVHDCVVKLETQFP